MPRGLKLTSLLLFLFSAVSFHCNADLYGNYHELTRSEKLGKDFEIININRNSSLTILTIHGGKIERGTSELGDLIAGEKFNRYDFRGIKNEKNFEALHITSTRFDEPIALQLVKNSEITLSIHSYLPEVFYARTICIGGANRELARELSLILKTSPGFLPPDTIIEYPCNRYPAASLENIVNKSKQYGVQLEISTYVYDYFKAHLDAQKRFADLLALWGEETISTKSTKPYCQTYLE